MNKLHLSLVALAWLLLALETEQTTEIFVASLLLAFVAGSLISECLTE